MTSSNWPRIHRGADRSDGRGAEPTVPLQDVPVEVEITARLLHVTMKLVSDRRYSESEALSVRLRRDPETRSEQIVYIYKNITRNPKPTDEQFHFGSGCIDILQVGGKLELRGTYWTNRNWARALNTAGTIELRRPKQSRRRR